MSPVCGVPENETHTGRDSFQYKFSVIGEPKRYPGLVLVIAVPCHVTGAFLATLFPERVTETCLSSVSRMVSPACASDAQETPSVSAVGVSEKIECICVSQSRLAQRLLKAETQVSAEFKP